MYMKLQDPSTRTGLEVDTCSVSLGELMMCVRKAVARLRLQVYLKYSLRGVQIAASRTCWMPGSGACYECN